jgi:hypothetical protein
MEKIITLIVLSISLFCQCTLLSNFKHGDEDSNVGCISGDCINGEGTNTWANGEKYTGQWKDDKKHGKGIMYNPDGSIRQKGNFQSDKYIGEDI